MAVVEGGAGGGFGTFISSPTQAIQVTVPTIPLFVPDQARQILQRLINQTVQLALQEVAGRVSEKAGEFADTGALAQSFGAMPATATGGIELLGGHGVGGDVIGRVFSSLPYAIVMELGRRAGQPIGRAGIDAIGLWAQRKLGLSAADAAGVKWAIATSIVRQGIEGKHFFEEGVNEARPRVEMLFTILGSQLAGALMKPGLGQTGTA